MLPENLVPQVKLVLCTDPDNSGSAFGPGLAALCKGVRETGSLNAAAKGMGMAYSKAWRIIKTAEESLGFPLLRSTTGGRGGGGAELTPEAQDFLQRFRRFEEAVRGYADEAFLEIIG